MFEIYEKFVELGINTSLISLDSIEHLYPYWCYPLNAKPIGLEGGILYCFIEGYDEMVFASNPESCIDTNVYPLAKDFTDFLRLILACGSVNPIEQISWMSEEQFIEHVSNEKQVYTSDHDDVLKIIAKEFNLTPMEDPFDYVKDIQKNFDGSKIKYSDEYYNVLGLERGD